MTDDTLETRTVPQLTVHTSNLIASATLVLRYLGTAAAGATTLIGALGRHDLSSLIEWARSDEVTPFLTAVVTLALMGWGLWRQRVNHKRLLLTANAAPDAVAKVVS